MASAWSLRRHHGAVVVFVFERGPITRRPQYGIVVAAAATTVVGRGSVFSGRTSPTTFEGRVPVVYGATTVVVFGVLLLRFVAATRVRL